MTGTGRTAAASSMEGGNGLKDGGAGDGGEAPLVRVFRKNKNARLPRYATGGAAGADVEACLAAELVLAPGERVKVPTGLALEIPRGWEAQVRPRSGLALRYGVTVLNAPGTIDSDYRGELEILLVNTGGEPYTVRPGDRIAQLVFAPAPRVRLEDSELSGTTGRGGGGFGSTGV
ncbi:MAG: dUTP diphosphatase [Treponema sp.]|jgi:dUTP pyrophosphatase|nr:dUTP diphosphatase [Treponema sp.]